MYMYVCLIFSIGTKVEMKRLESQFLDGQFDPRNQGIPSTSSPQPPTVPVENTTQGKRRNKNGMNMMSNYMYTETMYCSMYSPAQR